MALSFPRALPSTPYFESLKLRIQRIQAAVPLRGATNPVADLGPAVWIAEPKTVKLPPAAFKEWRAWGASLRGGSRTFLLTDPDYTAAAGGSPAVNTFDADAGTITIKTLTAAHTITAGDRMTVTYAATSHRALFVVTEGGTADGSGNLTVSVEPQIVTGIATNDAINLSAPDVEMSITPGSWTEEDMIGGHGTITFACSQYVRTA